jgi:3D (Asp-Asp-Asp) domain-containing protein
MLKKWHHGTKSRNILAAAAILIFLFGTPFLLRLDSMANIISPEPQPVSGSLIPPYTAAGQTASDEEEVNMQKGNDFERSIKMKATAYDLSVASCGKRPGEPGYGITCSGTKAKVGRTVAVDPEVVPLGSRLLITFPEEYGHLNGIYIAEDTGRLIKGNTIDIFFGEDRRDSTEVYDKAMKFGVRYVNVAILE